MSDYAVAVSTWLAGDLATRWLSRLSWSPHLPMAVTLELPETPYGDLTILWRFARDLLADGMAGPVGEGDVRVAPGPAPDGTDMSGAPSSSGALTVAATDPVATHRPGRHVAPPAPEDPPTMTMQVSSLLALDTMTIGVSVNSALRLFTNAP